MSNKIREINENLIPKELLGHPVDHKLLILEENPSKDFIFFERQTFFLIMHIYFVPSIFLCLHFSIFLSDAYERVERQDDDNKQRKNQKHTEEKTYNISARQR
jgi:hypothetical protein